MVRGRHRSFWLRARQNYEKVVGQSVGVSSGGGVTHTTQIPGTLSYVTPNTHVRNGGGLVGSVVGTGLTRSIKQS
jgi:hypothetical protein